MTAESAIAEPPAVMTAVAPRRRRAKLPLLNLAGAAIVSAAVLYVSFFPVAGLPALGAAFNPTTGAWTMAADAQVTDRMLHLSGLQQPVRVVLEKDGTAHVTARTDHDLFVATGYVHAKFRLFQMDLLRRQGAGRLSEIVGKVALDTDRFELQLGLLRTAELEWAQLPASDPLRDALLAYAQGVNDRITEAESTHQLDAMFTLLGYHPQPWTPVDSLLVKGDMTQTLNFTDTPLVMALLNKSLGTDLASEWFPILPPNQQAPYDPGPYGKVEPPQGIATMTAMTDAQSASAQAVYERLAALPAGLVSKGGASNNWAVAGAKSASGGALLAGDPHLHLTLPAIWFQLTQESPGFHTSGVSIPGTPGVLIGHNQHIAWSLTDAQNQQTFFYMEKEDSKTHPGMYFWNGAWRKYITVSYQIPVLGGATEHLTVKWSVHGPVISERGQTTSVWWSGNLPSQDLGVLMNAGRASNWQEFREALRGWYSPTHNFVYADDKGNIGLISAGYYPQVAKGQPWMPMPGTGEYDVTGTIPYDDIPQAYNPPDGIIWSANQRQVTSSYPYYIGTASNFFDPGYRANEIHRVLSQPGKLSASDMQALQTDTHDFLASEIVPVLLQSLSKEQLTPQESTIVQLLRNWDFRMEINSSAATIWSYFYGWYVYEVFNPWWKSRAVPVEMQEISDTLDQDLEAWTLHDPSNRAFSAPGVGSRSAADAQRAAFHKMIPQIAKDLGKDPNSWTWGRVHLRVLENLAEVKGLNYGPRPDRGDGRTPLAAGDYPSTHGPSWRMVVDWGSGTFQGIYPGGQSENPASDWYMDRVDTWFAGRLNPMLTAEQAVAAGGIRTWDMRP